MLINKEKFMKEGQDIISTLQMIPKEEVQRKQKFIEEIAPRLQYSVVIN